jgi:hypothetical protein
LGKLSYPYLYRIVSFDRLVEMLQSDELYFAHPSSWEDPYETHLQHKDSPNVFGQCWCKRAVSDAMWRIYSPNHLGVRIRTTRHRLKQAMTEAARSQSIEWRIQDVKYLPPPKLRHELESIADMLWQRNSIQDTFAPLFLKRDAFQHEDEVRVVVLNAPEKGQPIGGQCRLRVVMRWLVDSILVDPRAPDAYVEAYKHYLKDKLQFSGSFGKSALYARGDEIDAGPAS